MIKINNLPTPVEIAPAKTALDEVSQRKIKLKKATEAFEAIFIAQMLKSMRTTSFTAKEDEETGFGKDIMLSMADEAVSKQLSKSGVFGIGDILYNNLIKRIGEYDDKGQLKITSQRHIDGVAPPRATGQPAPASRVEQNPIPPTTSEPVKKQVIDATPRVQLKTVAPAKPPVQPDAVAVAHDRLGRYVDHIREAAEANNLPEDLLRAVIKQESSGNQNAVSSRGALGLMQLMPDTARSVGVRNPLDARENIMGGARYLRQMIDRFGDLETALAAYNAGPGNVERHGGVPPFPETRKYVKQVLSELSQAKPVNKSSSLTEIEK